MINILKKIGWFIKEEKKTYIFMFFLLLLISAISLAPAYVLGVAIDTIVSSSLNLKNFIWLLASLITLPLARYFMSFLYNHLITKEAQKLSFKLRYKYLDHLFKMDSKFYEKYTKGDLITRVTSDLEQLTVAATSLLEGIIFNIGVIVFAISVMSISISWKLTLISVSIMPIGLTILNIIRSNKRKYYKVHQEIYAAMTEKVIESVEGQKTIRAYTMEENDLVSQDKAIVNDIESWRYIVKFENWFNPLFEVIYGLAYVLAFAFGVYYIINQEITLGQLIIFVSYISMLYAPIISVSTMFQQINNATISATRIDEIMSYVPEVHDTKESKEILNFKTIEFKNVSFQYPFDTFSVLKDINFTIKAGQTIGIVGPTGAGKSTLIRQLLREFNVTKGDILIDNVSIEEFKIEDVHNLVGYVPQAHMLFKRSVDANILIGNPKASNKDLDRAVKIADFEKDLLYLHDGLSTLVEESGSSLSGGQKQRLSIARAIIRDPQILIMDDSLSAVDAKTEVNITNHLKTFRKGKTNIIVTHRFSAVYEADVIYVLENGTITQSGTHEQLLKEDGWYKRQYISQITIGSDK
ncbi:MAG: ABC transporter ATP-binding protein/permease [Acholeplasmatales bacterium]|jgi:ATP-binding cassette subfamily B protein|nr:ABC transporter ATP-binding protein/permease [Acholeplasmatales bacterium]